jgi:uncharacterized protein (DUF2147 family)
MLRRLSIACVALLLGGTSANADPIEGKWKTQLGNTAEIVDCGGSFCITLKTGPDAGKQIGTMKPSGDGKYAGKITDPANDKTYSGKASLSGASLSMSGCVFGGLICRSQTWTKM